MSDPSQKQLDTEALRTAVEARTMALGVKESFLQFRTEIHNDIADLRGEMGRQHSELRGEVAQVSGQLTTMSASLTNQMGVNRDKATQKWLKIGGTVVVGLLGIVGFLLANGRPWA